MVENRDSPVRFDRRSKTPALRKVTGLYLLFIGNAMQQSQYPWLNEKQMP